MIPFAARKGTSLLYTALCKEGRQANLSFLAADMRDVVLLVSLRPAEGVVLVNDCIGGVWGMELRAPLAPWELPEADGSDDAALLAEAEAAQAAGLPPLRGMAARLARARARASAGVERCVGVVFGGDSLRILVEGRTQLRLPAARFDPARIAAVAPGREVRLASLTVDGAPLIAPSFAARLQFGAGFVVEGVEFDPLMLKAGAELAVDGLEDRLPCILTEATAGAEGNSYAVTNLEAPLPGRIWAAPGPAETRQLTLWATGAEAPLARLTVSKAGIAAAIDALAGRAQPETAIFETLSAIEHVRYGGLFERLTPRAAAFVRAAVARFALEEFLELPEAEAGPAPEPAAPSPEQVFAVLVRDEFSARMRAEPGADPIAELRTLLARYRLSPASSSVVLVALAEYFCSVDRFEGLFELWTGQGHGPAALEGNDSWKRSAALPFLMLHGRHDQMLAALAELPKDDKGWINTACVGWCLTKAFAEPGQSLSLGALEQLVRGFIALVDAQAKNYWSRAHCVQLIRATQALLANLARLSAPQQKAVTAFCLRCYGLSPEFWQGLDAAGTPLPPEIAAARAAFAVIARAVAAQGTAGTEGAAAAPEGRAKGKGRGKAEGKAEAAEAPAPDAPARAEIEAALRVFGRWNPHDLDRFRLELFGPAGLLPPGAASLAPLAAEGVDSGEALLRHLAFPGAAPLPESFAPAARRAVQERHPSYRQAGNYELVRDTTRAAQSLLDLAIAGDEAGVAAALGPLMGDLGHLAGPQEGFVGLGLGLALLAGLLPLGTVPAARARVGSFLLDRLEALPEEAHRELRETRLIRAVFTRFHTEAVAEGSPLALALLAHVRKLTRLSPRLPEAPLPEMETLWRAASPLYDTLVCLYSCRANLDTRVQAVRDSWLHRLAVLGVPHLVVVGDGPKGGALEGDVLAVDAPDTYEALPLKTLAMLRWVGAKTPFAHVLKIDDDCLLDAEEFFQSLSYRQFNYYGRDLKRAVGTKPRAWHMEKSATGRARAELDKSPEPATYADGGSGYVLSREALGRLAEVADTPEGQWLVQISYSEDKLVGDLLARAGIGPQSQNHFTAVLRTTHPGGRPILQWDNSFLPGRMSGIKLAHLDNADDMRARAAAWGDNTLHPRKIWPTTRRVALGYNSNALELISPEARLAAAARVPVAVAAVVRNEMFMLPHFLAHYRRLGVEGFLIVDNASDDGTLEYLEAQPDVAVFSADTHFRLAAQGTDWKLAMMAQFRPGRWTLVADADELLVYRGWEDEGLAAHLAGPGFAEADAVLLWMLDMYPEGPLSEATFASGDPFAEAGFVEAEPFRENSLGRGSFSNRQTRTSALRHRLIPNSRPELFVAEKVALLRYRPWMRLSVGLHYATEVRMAAEPMILAHFKYNAEFRAKALREIARGQYFNNAEEYRKYVDILSEGRETVFDPAVSVPWRTARVIRDLLG